MANFRSGTVRTYDLVEGVIVDIDPLIRMMTPTDIPLQNGMGSDGRTVLTSDSIFEKKFEWQDEELLEPVMEVNGAVTTTPTTVTVATDQRIRASTGDVLLTSNGEQLLVTGYNASDDVLDVARAYAGTTAAAVVDASTLLILGANLGEGSDPEAARATDWNNQWNLTQIFGPTAVQVSGTEQVVRKYGLNTTMFDKQAANRTVEETIKYEQALIYGIRFDDTANARREMGGIDYHITTNHDSATTELTQALLLDQVEACYVAGGAPDKALIGPSIKRGISENWDVDQIRLGRADVGRGQTVDYMDTDFGRIDLCLHRRVRASDLFLFSREQAEQKVLRSLRFEMLGKTGDSIKGQVVMEKSLKFEVERWAAKFSALTGVAAPA